MGLVTQSKLPFEYWRWQLAEEYGWTLDYIDTLTMADFHEFLQVRDGKAKAKKSLTKR